MQIYTLYTCDAWKSTSSMRPYWQGTSFPRLILAIRKAIMEGTMDYDNSDGDCEPYQSSEHFMFCMHDCQEHDTREYLIRSLLEYGHIESTPNNTYL